MPPLLGDTFEGYADGVVLGTTGNWVTSKVTSNTGPGVMTTDSHPDHAPTQVIDMSDRGHELAVYQTELSSDNQDVSLDVFLDSDQSHRNEAGVLLRWQDGTQSGYGVRWVRFSNGDDRVVIIRWDDGSLTWLATSDNLQPTYPNGSIVRVRGTIIGSTITAYINDDLIITTTDTTYPSGKIGMELNRQYANTHSQPFVDNWVALDPISSTVSVNRLRLGGVTPSAIHVGSNAVQAVYLGSTLMFSPGSMDDTFPGTTLDPKWTERDIPGLGTIAVNDGLTLACPASAEGLYNPYGQVPLDRGLIIHQPHDGGDFEVRSNWTVLGGGTTSHGFVFANVDWTSWMRIDMIRFSNRYRWGIIDGSAGQGLWHNEPTLAQVSAPLLLRVGKQGDDWYGQWSIDDGATWDPGFTGITRALDVRHVGLMLGAGTSTSPTTGVDRFEFERL